MLAASAAEPPMVSAMYLPSLLMAWQPMQCPLPTLLFTAAGAPW